MKKIFDSLFSKKNKSRTICFALVVIVYIVITVAMNTVKLPRLFTGLLVPVCCYIIVALALNLTVGLSGELSLGHAGFMALGGFSAVCVSGIMGLYTDNAILRLVVSSVVAIVVSGVFGLLISVPVLKLKGDYLAIVTLAFGQIIQSLIGNIYLGYDSDGLHFSFINDTVELNGGKMLISGPMGATNTTKIASFTAGVIMILLALFVIYSLMNSKYGRAIMAARDNSIAAESIGISITKIKTLAFVISASIAGMAGALYALNFSTLQPAKFDFNTSILILVYVVFGGLGNILGTMISTAILYVLPELLRSLANYRMLIYSIVLILMMLITNNERLKTIFNKVLRKEKV